MTNSANNPIRIIAPSILTDIAWNEAEVLGGFVWLWQYHDYYRQASIESAISIILPIIQSKNFAFLVYKNQPLGYINWAYLSPEQELAYLNRTQPYEFFTQFNQPGPDKKVWILSWFCVPQMNHQLVMRTAIKRYIFPKQTVYFAYHKTPDDQKIVVKSLKGYKLTG